MEARLIDDTREPGEVLATEPRVTVILSPISGSNPPWEGGINGHFYRIPRGIPIDVPHSIAELIKRNEQVATLSREQVREYNTAAGKRLP